MGGLSLMQGIDQPGFCGEVVYIYAFDIAYELRRGAIESVLGQPVQQFTTGVSKRGPRHPFFYRPRMVTLPDTPRTLNGRAVTVRWSVKLFSVGAISIKVSVPFGAASLEDLVGYHNLTLDNGLLEAEVHRLAEQIRRDLAPYCIRPVDQVRDEEAYTIFCLTATGDPSAPQAATSEEWLLRNRRQIAALLTQEENPQRLSEQEAAESTGLYLAYYDSDLAVVDWDAALLLDEPENFEETIHVMELANVQLAELEAYDRILDDSLDRAYRDLTSKSVRRRPDVLGGLREIRVDMARLSDELQNTTKFLGDWHLARVYHKLNDRFHLSGWHATIDEKLRTLDSLYQLIKQDQTNRWMMILELTIVLLFIIDLIMLVLLPQH